MNTTRDKDLFHTNLLAVCVKSDVSEMNNILLKLINDLMKDDSTSLNLIQKCNLEDVLWDKITKIYGYKSQKPSLSDFIHEIFNECFNYETERKIKLKQEALIFINQWKNDKNNSESFNYFSKICEDNLELLQNIKKLDYRELLKIDYFISIDNYIINNINTEIIEKTITSKDVEEVIRLRNKTFWYEQFENYYEALKYSSLFFSKINEIELRIHTLEDGVKSYTDSWFLVDQYYRKFLFFSRNVSNADLLKEISIKVENTYSNNYLLKLNDRWQNLVDDIDEWNIKGYIKQSNFFDYYLSQKLQSGKKFCVIISDAMRYEIGEELNQRLNSENKLQSKINPMISSIPSYTQLGMASLLPNKKLMIKDDSYVMVDDKPSQGTSNRDKILKLSTDNKAIAIDSKKIMNYKTEELRQIIRDNTLIYIYHNLIDSTGGDTDSTELVNEAAEKTIDELLTISKKLISSNANNIYITADHGYIYQDREIDEIDFVGNKIDDAGIVYSDRRMILGRDLTENISLKHFTSKQLGLEGDLEIKFAKSINRLRKRGSGTKFVHGGTSLQEVIIPLISVNNKRKDDISFVDIEIHTSGKNIIKTGQLGIVFYQKDPVSDKIKSRELKIGIYTEDDKLISNEVELIFDSNSANPRERETTERFILSSFANKLNGETVYLRLKEPIPGTNKNKYKVYKESPYIINRLIETDF